MEEEQARIDFEKSLEKLKRTTLQIGRIPEQTKTRFLEIAKEEFANDYGMLLKWLVDYRDGLLSNPNEEILAKIEILANEISKLKEDFAKHIQEPKKENQIVMADGKIKRIGRGEKENGHI